MHAPSGLSKTSHRHQPRHPRSCGELLLSNRGRSANDGSEARHRDSHEASQLLYVLLKFLQSLSPLFGMTAGATRVRCNPANGPLRPHGNACGMCAFNLQRGSRLCGVANVKGDRSANGGSVVSTQHRSSAGNGPGCMLCKLLRSADLAAIPFQVE